MNYTDNLNLKKPAANDYADIQDINDNMDIIDQVMPLKADLVDGKVPESQLPEYADGTTFTPSVSEDGDLSWTNDGGLDNPTTVNIKGADGAPGADGQDGATGADGQGGADGADGLTTAISLEGETFTQVAGTVALPNFPMVASQTALARLGGGYGTCSTAADTAAKTVSISNFTLVTGGTVSVLFTNGNTNTASTLNINSTGAKQVWLQNARLGEFSIATGDLVHLVYDGTYYRILSIDSASVWTPPDFADATWDDVVRVSESGNASDYWSIGDTKTITLSTNEEIEVQIIGFDHDTKTSGGTAGITFQMVNCLDTKYYMNSSNTNSGGWTSCYMNTTVMPMLKGYLPSDLQSGISYVNKLTSAGSQSSTINTTSEDLWLLSEIEVFGSNTYAKSGEGSQYDLYSAGASKIKYVDGTASTWWLRSPSGSYSTGFVRVNTSGAADGAATNASVTSGVAVGFCI